MPAKGGTWAPAKSKGRSTDSGGPGGPAYQLRVTLLGVRPPVWRRVLVPSNASAEFLHHVIQVSMGWTDSHLHQFILGKRPNQIYALPPDPDSLDLDMPTLDSYQVTIRQLMHKSGGRFIYEYDFGDSWGHEVRLEKEVVAGPEVQVPACLDGGRACPPEDCGGVWGYADIVRMLKDPKYKPENGSREELMEWLEDFDPEAFDVAKVNAQLSPPPRKRSRSR